MFNTRTSFFAITSTWLQGLFCGAVKKVRGRLQNPPDSFEQYLEIPTRNGLVGTGAELRPFAELL